MIRPAAGQPSTSASVPVVLIIRDGWGENPNPNHAPFNAVEVARSRGLIPVDDRLRRDCPWTLIKTSGEDVGLPEGTMGNSEVGHQNIGAGRVVDQESVAITKACRAGLQHNPVIAAAIARCLNTSRALHLLGIASDAGVHGQLDHLFAILRACAAMGLRDRVYLHLFTDGRDTGPFTGRAYLQQVLAACASIGVGQVASLAGRYFAMDRDHRWERVARAFRALTGRGDGGLPSSAGLDTLIPAFPTVDAAIAHAYDHPAPGLIGDEFVPPCRIAPQPHTLIRDDDSVIFFNYRGDRPRELCSAFLFPEPAWAGVKPSPDSGRRGFDRGDRLRTHFVIMTEYWDELLPHVAGVAFPKPPKMRRILGEFLAEHGLTQLRCAETEKYPHVTFFFNDYREPPFEGELRDNPQSPKVATYDLQPEMSAHAVRDAVLARLRSPAPPAFTVVNFANGDMVGHTGNLEAAVKACATVDQCVGSIIDAVLERQGSLIITADHGNCEQMFDPATNAPHTAHTVYDVPLYVVGHTLRSARLKGDNLAAGWFNPTTRESRGRLADIAPTALTIMGLQPPPEMTGESLIISR